MGSETGHDTPTSSVWAVTVVAGDQVEGTRAEKAPGLGPGGPSKDPSDSEYCSVVELCGELEDLVSTKPAEEGGC